MSSHRCEDMDLNSQQYSQFHKFHLCSEFFRLRKMPERMADQLTGTRTQ